MHWWREAAATCSVSRQNFSGPLRAPPQVALATISASVARLRSRGKRPARKRGRHRVRSFGKKTGGGTDAKLAGDEPETKSKHHRAVAFSGVAGRQSANIPATVPRRPHANWKAADMLPGRSRDASREGYRRAPLASRLANCPHYRHIFVARRC